MFIEPCFDIENWAQRVGRESASEEYCRDLNKNLWKWASMKGEIIHILALALFSAAKATVYDKCETITIPMCKDIHTIKQCFPI